MRLYDGGNRTNSRNNGDVVGANAFHTIRKHKRGQHGGHHSQQYAVPDVGTGFLQFLQGAATYGKMNKNAGSRRKHGIGSKTRSAYRWYQSAAANNINAVRDRTQENEEAAPNKIRIADITDAQFAYIGYGNTGIGEQQGNFLRANNGLLKNKGIDKNREGGVEEKDQAFEAGSNILQPDKIEQAAEVITKKAESDNRCPLPAGQRGITFLPGQPYRGNIKGKGKGHA